MRAHRVLRQALGFCGQHKPPCERTEPPDLLPAAHVFQRGASEHISRPMRSIFMTSKSSKGVKPMPKTFRYLGAWFALALLAVFSAAPARADVDGHFDKTLTVTGAVDLDVSTGS